MTQFIIIMFLLFIQVLLSIFKIKNETITSLKYTLLALIFWVSLNLIYSKNLSLQTFISEVNNFKLGQFLILFIIINVFNKRGRAL
jgi:hypothetical protein